VHLRFGLFAMSQQAGYQPVPEGGFDKVFQASTNPEAGGMWCGSKSTPDQIEDDFKSSLTQISELEGLTQGQKLWLHSICVARRYCWITAIHKRALALKLDVAFGVCAGIVPILIPFSQTYKDSDLTIGSMDVNVGTVISLFAVLCSLMGTVIHVYTKASKVGELYLCLYNEAARKEELMAAFLTKSGPDYEGLDNMQALKMFTEKYNVMQRKYCKPS